MAARARALEVHEKCVPRLASRVWQRFVESCARIYVGFSSAQRTMMDILAFVHSMQTACDAGALFAGESFDFRVPLIFGIYTRLDEFTFVVIDKILAKFFLSCNRDFHSKLQV